MTRLSHVKVLLLPSVADPAPAATPRTPLKSVINDGSKGPGLPQIGPGLSTGPGKLKWNGPNPASFRLNGMGLGRSSAQASHTPVWAGQARSRGRGRCRPPSGGTGAA